MLYNNEYVPTRKTTIEECLVLNIDAFARAGVLAVGKETDGTWTWADPWTKKTRASMSYVADLRDPAKACIYLLYGEYFGGIGQPVMLQTTRPKLGGIRWWFTCPLGSCAGPCDKRVGRLYLPSSDSCFGCRHCYDLTYRCVQERRSQYERFRRGRLIFRKRLPYDLMALNLLFCHRQLQKLHSDGAPLLQTAI